MIVRRFQTVLTTLALGGAVLTCGPAAAGVASDLADLRQATAPFHSFDVATAAGWNVQLTGCIEAPDGGQGFHYANLGLIDDDGAVDPSRPEVLMFEPGKNGGFRLVGAEFIILEDDLPRTAPAPELFGQHFHFNEVFEVWALHAWVWRHNSDGMFANWNPGVSCEFAE